MADFYAHIKKSPNNTPNVKTCAKSSSFVDFAHVFTFGEKKGGQLYEHAMRGLLIYYVSTLANFFLSKWAF